MPTDTTSYNVIFRLKKSIENTTTPLIEVNAVKTLEGTSSTGYWDLDLSLTPLELLKGLYYYEVELNDGVNAPIFFGEKDSATPKPCSINVRLDND
jgi:hypothetical protein